MKQNASRTVRRPKRTIREAGCYILQAVPRSIIMKASIVIIGALMPWVLQAVGSPPSCLTEGDPRPLTLVELCAYSLPTK